ncbi:hypothetical protein [Acinetobacter seifertii]|uniref:hypothetical protein n=1 Tax=Acinetobacter seifertii TaxID=1530123 RepID=UPI00190663DB|nr:hypothetical protein [Acinetobacter seifertii]MBJ9424504.1 hypothetical protein [Acinetobacter seifertii]
MKIKIIFITFILLTVSFSSFSQPILRTENIGPFFNIYAKNTEDKIYNCKVDYTVMYLRDHFTWDRINLSKSFTVNKNIEEETVVASGKSPYEDVVSYITSLTISCYSS